jgi:hypothetical protein
MSKHFLLGPDAGSLAATPFNFDGGEGYIGKLGAAIVVFDGENTYALFRSAMQDGTVDGVIIIWRPDSFVEVDEGISGFPWEWFWETFVMKLPESVREAVILCHDQYGYGK